MPTNVPTLRLAIIGAGMIGRAHARAFRAVRESFYPPPALVELAVVADAVPELARDTQVRFEFERTAESWQAVADATDVDVAVVALPNFEHTAAVDALLAAGKHVLCEKPLALSAKEARRMLQAARRAGVTHGVGFNLRRSPTVATMRDLVARGVLGELGHFSAHYFTDYAASPEVPFTWRYQRSLAGSGALGDIGSHIIDLARFLVGELTTVHGAVLATRIAERPVPLGHVTGHSLAATTGERRAVDTDDFGAFTARFQHGAVGDFRFSRIATGHRNSVVFDLIGDRGALAFDMERAAEFRLFQHDADDTLNGFRRVVTGPRHPYFAEVTAFPVAGVGYGYSETYVAQAYEFVRAIVEQRAYTPSFEDGYAAVAVCEAVQSAAERGRGVALPGGKDATPESI